MLSFFAPSEKKPPLDAAAQREAQKAQLEARLESRLQAQLTSLPDLKKSGIVDHAAVARELLQGDSIRVYVGPERQLFTVPVRMLLYHCPIVQEHLEMDTKSAAHVLKLKNEDPEAFSRVCRWMHTSQIEICCSENDFWPLKVDLENDIMLLCKIWLLGDYLGMDQMNSQALKLLDKVFKQAERCGIATTLTQETILHVRKYLKTFAVDVAKCALWRVLIDELCHAMTSEPRPRYEDFKICIEKSPRIKEAVAKALHNAVIEKLQ